MPGITRNNEKQYIVAKNIGCSSWQEFVDHVESIDDDLPVITNLADNWGDKQEDLAPELIHGVLRRGHKLLISGPAKAGKSWSLMSLAIAMAAVGMSTNLVSLKNLGNRPFYVGLSAAVSVGFVSYIGIIFLNYFI